MGIVEEISSHGDERSEEGSVRRVARVEKEHEKKVILSEALERGQLVDHCVDSTCFSVVRGFVSRKLVYEMVIREKKRFLLSQSPVSWRSGTSSHFLCHQTWCCCLKSRRCVHRGSLCEQRKRRKEFRHRGK